MALTKLSIRHWLPIVTRCPVNSWPDVIFVTVEFDTFVELYAVRKKLRKVLAWKKIFMEDAAQLVLDAFPDSTAVVVTLAFNRHIVRLER